MKVYQHQKDMNGCGIACLANLLELPYDKVKKDFEKRFYTIEKGINIADMARYINLKQKRKYVSKFFNKKTYDAKEAKQYSEIDKSITLIVRSEKYRVGHYLLRDGGAWVDSWVNFPSIDNVHAGLRSKLPENVFYVLYPIE